jgi:hypothetical protein
MRFTGLTALLLAIVAALPYHVCNSHRRVQNDGRPGLWLAACKFQKLGSSAMLLGDGDMLGLGVGLPGMHVVGL